MQTWISDLDNFVSGLGLSTNGTDSTVAIAKWSPTLHEIELIVAANVFTFVLVFVMLRVVWKPPPKKCKAPIAEDPPALLSNPKSLPGPCDSLESNLSNALLSKGPAPIQNTPHILEAGEAAGPASIQETSQPLEAGEAAGGYGAPWTSTFDLVFLVGMLIALFALLVSTYKFKPSLLVNNAFWLQQLPKLAIMILVSCIGGGLCRRWCEVDANGYIMTNKSSWFKVNYTRKLQHFAAYAVPMLVKPAADCDCSGMLASAWGDWVTMLGFLIMIKPLRENFAPFMLQFNSLDRPEDRPHTLKWIIAGNIAPGLFLILFFQWALGLTGQQELAFLFVLITGIGDGLAEPVGITWGRHKYKSRACFSSRKYTRSWEGSACVFLSGTLFTTLMFSHFYNAYQFWFTFVLVGPVMAYAEATAPHTMDTPVLMTIGGSLLVLSTRLFPVGYSPPW